MIALVLSFCLSAGPAFAIGKAYAPIGKVSVSPLKATPRVVLSLGLSQSLISAPSLALPGLETGLLPVVETQFRFAGAAAQAKTAVVPAANAADAPRRKEKKKGKKKKHPLVKKAEALAESLSPGVRIEALSELLDVENLEQQAQERRMRETAVEVRQQLGTTVLNLNVEAEMNGLGGAKMLSLSQNKKGVRAPFHAFSRGDLVTLTDGRGAPADGTVARVHGNHIDISFEIAPEIPATGLRLEIGESDITHKRMKQALVDLAETEDGDTKRLRATLMGDRQAKLGKVEAVHFLNEKLDEHQRSAVVRALAAEDVALIHGPPGTGKTTTLVELIVQSVRRKQSVLATAPSNVAVNNLVEKLAEAGVRVVRVGNPARVGAELLEYTLDAQIEASEEGKLLVAVREQLAELEPGTSEYRQKLTRIRAWEKKLKTRILDKADVVLGTQGGISTILRGRKFDVAVLDEASQAVEPLSWIPIQLARKVVLAGDPMQLPPTLHSMEAADRGLAVTLMERLIKSLPEGLTSLLRMQYRMHQHIMDFASEEFYDGKLIAAESVRTHLASDLPGVQSNDLTENPVQFIDTVGTDFDEDFDSLTQSYHNEGEAALIGRLYQRLLDSGLRPEQIGVITPYSSQKRLLRQTLGDEASIEVNTVDGFQGREKEVILFSAVRSNRNRDLGFLRELRRLNVAITRPRRLLVFVGDSRTLSRHGIFKRFMDRAKARGYSRSAFEF
ncbi:MAG: hypothetical protein COB53_11995 [Elusimicrobia bacterium]|nr:MAG: hypothetical protein COB53_11995 [Elusimicrobiota bacterium]